MMLRPASPAAFALSLLVLLAAPALSAEPEAPAPDARAPEWKPCQLPSYYPELARDKLVEGRAVIRCTVTDRGGLKDCVAIEEDPKGYGFGAKAVEMACLFRYKLGPGRLKPGDAVNVPLKFKL